MRASDAASVVRKARRPKPWMNFVPQVESSVEQLPNIVSLLADAAQAAIASALSCSCEAFSSCTSNACASMANPRLVGSLNTVAIGAAFAVSLKMARMLAVNWGPVSRQSLRGPGALLVQASGVASAFFGGVTTGPPPVPAVLPPSPAMPVSPATPEPLPAAPFPAAPLPAAPLPAAPLPAAPLPAAPLPAAPDPLPPRPGSPGIDEPWPAQPDAVRIAATATRQGRSIRTSWEGQKAKRIESSGRG